MSYLEALFTRTGCSRLPSTLTAGRQEWNTLSFPYKRGKKITNFPAPLDARYARWSGLFFSHLPEFEFFLIYFKSTPRVMGSQASKGGVAVEGKAADADPAAVKTNGQVIHLHLRHTHI